MVILDALREPILRYGLENLHSVERHSVPELIRSIFSRHLEKLSEKQTFVACHSCQRKLEIFSLTPAVKIDELFPLKRLLPNILPVWSEFIKTAPNRVFTTHQCSCLEHQELRHRSFD